MFLTFTSQFFWLPFKQPEIIDIQNLYFLTPKIIFVTLKISLKKNYITHTYLKFSFPSPFLFSFFSLASELDYIHLSFETLLFEHLFYFL